MSEKLKLPTLLIIADNPSIYHWIKKNLEGKFYLIEASTQSTALKIAQSANLDFIILDSHFEECDPLDLAIALRQINTLTPIFLITDRLKKSFRDRAIAAGITDFLNDQLSMDELEIQISLGQKSAQARKKTSEFSPSIAAPTSSLSDNFLKKKILSNEKILVLIKELKQPLSLLLVRMDHYHELQKSEGSLETEFLLSLLYKRLSTLLRSHDRLYPISNGFFIMLLPETSFKEAQRLSEQLRRTVQHDSFDLTPKSIDLSISIIISALNGTEEQYQKIIAQGIQSFHESPDMTNFIIILDKEKP